MSYDSKEDIFFLKANNRHPAKRMDDWQQLMAIVISLHDLLGQETKKYILQV